MKIRDQVVLFIVVIALAMASFYAGMLKSRQEKKDMHEQELILMLHKIDSIYETEKKTINEIKYRTKIVRDTIPIIVNEDTLLSRLNKIL